MAVIKMGSIVTDIRGKVGGHVFKTSARGHVLNTKVVGKRQPEAVNDIRSNKRLINPQGVDVQGAMAGIVLDWQLMSAAQQMAWSAYASTVKHKNKVGEAFTPSAYNAYVAINAALINNGAGGTLVPPSTSDSLYQFNFTITTCTSSSIGITNAAANPASTICCIKATRSLNNGTTPQKNKFSIIDYNASMASGTYSLTSKYEAVFGAPITGQVLWLSSILTDINTGQQSPIVYQSHAIA